MLKPITLILALSTLSLSAHALEWEAGTSIDYQASEALPLADNTATYNELRFTTRELLKFTGLEFSAPDQPMDLPVENQRGIFVLSTSDRLSRLEQERLASQLGGYAWQSTVAEAEFRWFPPEAGKRLLSPYVSGGVTLTSINQPGEQSNNSSNPLDNTAQGWRYGAGVAYSYSDTLDMRFGYRASAITSLPARIANLTSDSPGLRSQLVDVSLSYRF